MMNLGTGYVRGPLIREQETHLLLSSSEEETYEHTD
jgi:hypothetical protein